MIHRLKKVLLKVIELLDFCGYQAKLKLKLRIAAGQHIKYHTQKTKNNHDSSSENKMFLKSKENGQKGRKDPLLKSESCRFP